MSSLRIADVLNEAGDLFLQTVKLLFQTAICNRGNNRNRHYYTLLGKHIGWCDEIDMLFLERISRIKRMNDDVSNMHYKAEIETISNYIDDEDKLERFKEGNIILASMASICNQYNSPTKVRDASEDKKAKRELIRKRKRIKEQIEESLPLKKKKKFAAKSPRVFVDSI